MGHRLSKITTRTGDQGETGLGDGSRTVKHARRIAVLGEVDELNSLLGVLLAEPMPAQPREFLLGVQQQLFNLGGALSIPGMAMLDTAAITALEAQLTALNHNLPPLKEFILPGGTRSAALAHLARSVCRRAERSLSALCPEEAVDPLALPYLNRLSDVLFVLARALNRDAGYPDQLWQRDTDTPP